MTLRMIDVSSVILLVPWRMKNVHDMVAVLFSSRLGVYHFRLANVHLFVTFSEEITWIRDWQLSRTFGNFGIALSVSSETETGFPLFGLTDHPSPAMQDLFHVSSSEDLARFLWHTSLLETVEQPTFTYSLSSMYPGVIKVQRRSVLAF